MARAKRPKHYHTRIVRGRTKRTYDDKREYVIPYESGICEADIPDLFALPPDGCQRRLFYKKTKVVGLEADQIRSSRIKILNLLLSNIVMQQYRDVTKRNLRKANRHWRSDLTPYLTSYYPAFWVKRPEPSVPALLEVLPEDEYTVLRATGSPGEALTLQLQHIMHVAERDYALFVGLCLSEPLHMISFDVVRDEAVINTILDKAKDFWSMKEKEEAPDKYEEPTHPACLFCEYRRLCHGKIAFGKDGVLDVLVKHYLQMGARVDRLVALEDFMEQKIQNKLGASYSADTYWGKVEYETKTQTVLDAGRLLKDYPKLKQKYSVSKAVKRIVVKG